METTKTTIKGLELSCTNDNCRKRFTVQDAFTVQAVTMGATNWTQRFEDVDFYLTTCPQCGKLLLIAKKK
jgi:hypothetical protein